jgi:hypothetical protein
MNIDIILIDNKIQQYFLDESSKIDKYKETLQELDKLLNSDEIGDSIKNKLIEEQKLYKEKIEDLTNMTSYNFYIVESVPIIESYKKILRTPVKISFFSIPENATPNENKDNLISQYIQISKKYLKNIDIDIDFTTKSKKVVCDDCGSKKIITSDTIFLICQDCGYEKDLNGTKISYKDISRTTILQKYTYERRSHFRDCINQFQGKQICKLEPGLDEALEHEFEKHHMLIGDKNTAKDTRYKNVELEHVMLFLKELGYDKQYDNAKYIYSIITGKKWPDLSHLEDQLMSDFDVLVNAYVKKYKYENKIARKSFMNIQYVLFQLLNKNKYPCKKEDFNILKTNDRKTFHDDIAKSLFEELGWNHVALF